MNNSVERKSELGTDQNLFQNELELSLDRVELVSLWTIRHMFTIPTDKITFDSKACKMFEILWKIIFLDKYMAIYQIF